MSDSHRSLTAAALSSKWTRVLLFTVCLLPAMNLARRAWIGRLGANPIEFITHETGDWTLIFLVAVLSVSPLRRLLRQSALIRFRRMIGLFAFFYACLHFTTFLWLDKFFDFAEMIRDVAKRPFITAGFFGFILLVPLAVTSTAGWIRRLGGKNWQRLHRLVYITAVAGVVHYYWLVKSDITKPVRYGVIMGLLLGYRIVSSIYRRRAGRR